MVGTFVMRAHWFKVILAVSVVLAFFGWYTPGRQRPLDFHDMLWRSIPLACLWALIFAFSTYRFGRTALWMLLGAPLALYWPIWLLLHGIPACFRAGNCE
jgi:hypothetical protein